MAREAATIYLVLPLLEESSGQPGDRLGALCPAIWPCTGWGLPCPRCHHRGGELLPRHFTLILPYRKDGVVSVALSVGLPRPAVSGHPAQWCSDFPPFPLGRAAARRPCTFHRVLGVEVEVLGVGPQISRIRPHRSSARIGFSWLTLGSAAQKPLTLLLRLCRPAQRFARHAPTKSPYADRHLTPPSGPARQ